DVVVAQCGRGGRRDDSRRQAAGRDGHVPGTPADTAGDPPAARECVSPGMGDTLGGLAASRAHAAGPFCPGTLARRTAVGRGGSRACQGHAEGCMRNRGESAAEAGRENLYIINGLQKTSPLKGSRPRVSDAVVQELKRLKGLYDGFTYRELVRIIYY